ASDPLGPIEKVRSNGLVQVIQDIEGWREKLSPHPLLCINPPEHIIFAAWRPDALEAERLLVDKPYVVALEPCPPIHVRLQLLVPFDRPREAVRVDRVFKPGREIKLGGVVAAQARQKVPLVELFPLRPGHRSPHCRSSR